MQNGSEVSKRMLGVFMQVNKCLLENRNEFKGIAIKKGRMRDAGIGENEGCRDMGE